MKLGEICEPKQWKSLKQADMTSEGYPVYGANGVIGHYGQFNHLKPTVLIGCRGTCGQINVCEPYSYVTSNAMCLDNLSESVDLQYLVCFLKTFDFSKIIGGSSQPQLTKRTVSNIEVPIPDLGTQKRISSKFEQTDKLRRLALSQLSKLDELVKSRFLEMFGGSETPCVRLESCCVSICGGMTPSTKREDYYGGDIPFVKSGDVGSEYVSNGALWLTGKALEETSAKYVPAGSVLVVTRSALLLRKIATSIAANDLVINQDIKSFLPSKEYLPEYLLWAIRSREKEILGKVISVSTSHIDTRDLAALPIPKTPIEKQREFADFVAQVDKSGFAIDHIPVLVHGRNFDFIDDSIQVSRGSGCTRLVLLLYRILYTGIQDESEEGYGDGCRFRKSR